MPSFIINWLPIAVISNMQLAKQTLKEKSSDWLFWFFVAVLQRMHSSTQTSQSCLIPVVKRALDLVVRNRPVKTILKEKRRFLEIRSMNWLLSLMAHRSTAVNSLEVDLYERLMVHLLFFYYWRWDYLFDLPKNPTRMVVLHTIPH